MLRIAKSTKPYFTARKNMLKQVLLSNNLISQLLFVFTGFSVLNLLLGDSRTFHDKSLFLIRTGPIRFFLANTDVFHF